MTRALPHLFFLSWGLAIYCLGFPLRELFAGLAGVAFFYLIFLKESI